MNKPTHTPSWKQYHTNGNYEIWDSNNQLVFRIKEGCIPTHEGGNLIAAAPAMYEALRMLTSEINLSTLKVRKDFSLMNAHACAVKAILQAEGKLL